MKSINESTAIYVTSVIMIILGILYLSLSIFLYKIPCESTFWWYGIVAGIIAIFIGIGSVLVNYNEGTRYATFRIIVVLLLLTSIEIFGTILLVTQKGSECRANGSNLWLSMMITHLIMLPVIAVSGLVYFSLV